MTNTPNNRLMWTSKERFYCVIRMKSSMMLVLLLNHLSRACMKFERFANSTRTEKM